MKLAGIFGNIPTPIAILRTSCGSLCFTTPDLRSRMEGSFISQLEVGDFMGKSFELNMIPNRIVRIMDKSYQPGTWIPIQ